MNTHKIVIVTDSSAHIPEPDLQGLDIVTIPLWLIWDEQRYRDSVDIDPPTFYSRLKSSKTLPSSSQPTPGEFIELFQDLAKTYDHIFAVLVSGGISGTFASAVLAKENLPDLDIHLIDTKQSAMGAGIAVLTAARAAAEGKSIEEVIALTKAKCEKTFMVFVVDTLEYLHRGGRIGGAKRLLGSALKIKPLLHFSEGTIQPLASIRTKAKAIQLMLDKVEEKISGSRILEAAVMDIDVPEEARALAAKLKERFNIPVLHMGGVSPVVGTHVGPGALGVAFCIE
jgi:DegV family protein with EDD domain